MDNSFIAYLQRLELISFFSGYSLIYTISTFITANRPLKILSGRFALLLPMAYAIVGALYLGFILDKLFPDYSITNIKLVIQQPYLIIFGLLANLFWIPAIAKKKVWSLIHSLFFVCFLVKDLFLQFITPSADNNLVRNDMKMYAVSILLNAVALLIVILGSFLFSRYKNVLSTKITQ